MSSSHKHSDTSSVNDSTLNVGFNLTNLLSNTYNYNELPCLGVLMHNVNVFGQREHQGTNISTIYNRLLTPFVKPFKRNTKTAKHILKGIDLLLKPNEMTLVLGAPGSGCTALLKTICGQVESYSKIQGDVNYSGLTLKDMKKKYLGELVYNQEDDVHYQSLSVEQTLRFAIKTKTPAKSQKGLDEQSILEMVLQLFGLVNCRHVKVGGHNIKGISGGEKKRLSIAEQVIVGSSVNAWDGSTKGLDSQSAYDFIKALRVMSDVLNKTTVVSLYQTSEDVYSLFDYVMLLDNGKCLYYGPVKAAKQYFVDLGFECPARCSTADFLTTISDRNVIYNATLCTSIENKNLNAIYKNSHISEQMKQKMKQYRSDIKEKSLSAKFEHYAVTEKGYKRTAIKRKIKGPYISSWMQQFKACFIREFQLFWGNKFGLYSKLFINLALGTAHGAIYFQISNNSSDAYNRVGAIYSVLLFNVLSTLAELPKALNGRDILYKHRSYAMHSISAYHIARIASDMPLIFIQIIPFCTIFYLMAGLQFSLMKFCLFFVTMFATNLANSEMFRTIASVSKNINIANFVANSMLVLLLLYNGYLIPLNNMKAYFRPIYYINHLAHGLKSLLINEFDGLEFICNKESLVPSGVEYDNIKYQACIMPGSTPGTKIVNGLNYIRKAYGVETTQNTEYSVFWEILVIFVFWGAFVCLTLVFMKLFAFGQPKTLKRATKKYNSRKHYVEKKASNQSKEVSKDYMWFNNLSYKVIENDAQKTLFSNISGYIKPGSLVALMGSSGAGKTTLMNYLSFRTCAKKEIREGNVFLGDKIFTKQTAKQIGYCEQIDLHYETSTIRESLRFSAYLRQPKNTSKHEKDAYVEEVIDLLDLRPIANDIVGSPENKSGISLEARKKLTIGIELVAKPQILFLDEPTSGMDSRASLVMVRFLKKLSESGKSILCTIHQPSAYLFEHFDNLILLGKGGKMVYHGPIGDNSCEIIDYFEKNKARKCLDSENPAEYILEVIGAGVLSTNTKDWSKVWAKSQKAAYIQDFIVNGLMPKIDFVSPKLEQRKNVNFLTQLKLVMGRMFVCYLRTPNYNLTRYVNQVFVALMLGFSFFQLKNSENELNNRFFAIFQVVGLGILSMINVQSQYFYQFKFFQKENKSGFYDWKSFSISLIFVEIPFSLTASVIFSTIFYYMVGFTAAFENFAIFVVSFALFGLFATSLGQAISAISPNLDITSVITPFFTVSMALFSGVSITYENIPVYFRYWLYWLNPYHYILETLTVNEMKNIMVNCTQDELIKFLAPINTTCMSYVDAYLKSSPGYLDVYKNNANSTLCNYCMYKDGNSYIKHLSWDVSKKYWDILIIAAYWCLNIALIVIIVRKKTNKV